MSHRQKSGIVIGVIIGFMVLILGGYLCWKRRMNMLRGAQRLRKSSSFPFLAVVLGPISPALCNSVCSGAPIFVLELDARCPMLFDTSS